MAEYEIIEIVKPKNKTLSVIQNITNTRIRRDSNAKYANIPSREIKKWFESRRI